MHDMWHHIGTWALLEGVSWAEGVSRDEGVSWAGLVISGVLAGSNTSLIESVKLFHASATPQDLSLCLLQCVIMLISWQFWFKMPATGHEALF